MLATASSAIVIGFNVRPDSKAQDAAEREGVDVRTYRIIYQAIEDMEKAMKGLLKPEFKEVVIGHAEIRNVIRISSVGIVAGSYVTDGKVDPRQPGTAAARRRGRIRGQDCRPQALQGRRP